MENTCDKTPVKWYLQPWGVAVAIFCLGPLGLIPLWCSPAVKKSIKITVSIAVMAVTIWMARETAVVVNSVADYYRQLSSVM